MARVECLAARAVHVEIDESNLRGQLKVCDFVEYSRADIARTDDDNFSPIDGHNNDLLKMQKSPRRSDMRLDAMDTRKTVWKPAIS